ncbi:hypothetical protein PtA15_5A215 [Puccinia triticina]|uniref:Uncharacterized protein n=1 Tax=Puccinia triticina TaxID=208348 RepID=A0ABY7CPF4_9BASI|nr:uncharacterized protein PtA15_5A215 [Puccinia triticina]WAQ84642.1 hypothetical protein PtA15_5A215 [Puccinia triticina]
MARHFRSNSQSQYLPRTTLESAIERFFMPSFVGFSREANLGQIPTTGGQPNLESAHINPGYTGQPQQEAHGSTHFGGNNLPANPGPNQFVNPGPTEQPWNGNYAPANSGVNYPGNPYLPTNPGPMRNANPPSSGSPALDPLPEPFQPVAGQSASISAAQNYQMGTNTSNPHHLLEANIQLPAYNPEPFGRKPVKIKSMAKGLFFDGSNMEISNFIKRLENAAQLDGALGCDIAIQITVFLEGEALINEVQEMTEQVGHDWEKLKLKLVQRWGKMLPLLKYTRNDLDKLLFTTQAKGIKTQKEFQDFSIKLDNLVAYLFRCQHMASAEEIRHAVLNCVSTPIKVSVCRELLRDRQMQSSVDGSHILPPYLVIMHYISKEFKTLSILEEETTQEKPLGIQQPAKMSQQNQTQDKSMDQLTRNLASWNVQKPSPFISSSHVPYKPAQYERDPATLKCNYCHMMGHTMHRCNLVNLDELNGLYKKEGNTVRLPDGSQIPWDRNTPYKATVDQFHQAKKQPGVIHLPSGTLNPNAQASNLEPQVSFGIIEHMDQDVEALMISSRRLPLDSMLKIKANSGDLEDEASSPIRFMTPFMPKITSQVFQNIGTSEKLDNTRAEQLLKNLQILYLHLKLNWD